MRIEYTTKDGSRTVAQTASLALCHWFMRYTDRVLPENPEPFTVYRGPAVVGPYDESFLAAIIACCERNWNKKPDFKVTEWCGDGLFPIRDFKDVVLYRDRQNGEYRLQTDKVIAYEADCMKLLKWLQKHGDIASLTVEDDYKWPDPT
jgi:hypothetical protein